MNVDWERVTTLFAAARTLDEADRRAFLDAACGTDGALRQEVDALLAHDTDDEFLVRSEEVGNATPLALVRLLASGSLLKDRYRIEQPLGGGGQALVYRATDEVLHRTVVVKVMRATRRDNRWLKSRFEREMEALSRIDHPGVVGILDVGDLDDGSPFLVIQHIDGMSLRERLADGPIDVSRSADIVRQLGAALAAAHTAGVAHQDLKPENVMLQRPDEGREAVRLIDFGIAKVDRSPVEAGVTTVRVAGTIRYMAPEQFEGRNSPACDVYALALVTCEMLSGQPDLRALPGRIGGKARRLLESALALRPEDRPADIRTWSQDVSHALVAAFPVRRRLVLSLTAAAVAIVALTAAARVVADYYREPARVVEKIGAFDPLHEGFLAHNRATGTVSWNPQGDGYDGWRAFGSGAGDYYYKKLSRAQKRLAMERGWTLTTLMRAEEGTTFVDVDLVPFGKRYNVHITREGALDRVMLVTQIVPTIEGLDVRVPHEPGAYHRYDLRYDASLQKADLFIDGVRRLENFRGTSHFQDDMGLLFGVGPYRRERGAGSFQSVRFEISP